MTISLVVVEVLRIGGLFIWPSLVPGEVVNIPVEGRFVRLLDCSLNARALGKQEELARTTGERHCGGREGTQHADEANGRCGP